MKMIYPILALFAFLITACSLFRNELNHVPPHAIKLQTGVIYPSPLFDQQVLRKADHNKVYIILQFSQLPESASLIKNHIESAYYIDSSSIIAAVPSDFNYKAVENLIWMSEIKGAFKFDKSLLPELHSLNDDQTQWVYIEAYNGVENGKLLALLRNHNLKSMEIQGFPDRVRLVQINHEMDLISLSEENLVYFISPYTASKNQTIYYCPGPRIEGYGYLARFVLNSNGWGAQNRKCAPLNFTFINGTSHIPASDEWNEVVRALDTWSEVSGIAFSKISSPNASRSIDISWEIGNHSDGSPFDGTGGVLAHTFIPSPPNPEPIAGNVHFDDAENWAMNGHTNLYSVAVHEIGHALGLGHSSVTGAVMYPYYSGPINGLDPDDIMGIISLYPGFSVECQPKHFWTADPNGELLPKPEYHSEGIAFYSVTPTPNTVPVYRYYDAEHFMHFWTTGISGESLSPMDYKSESIAFLASTSGTPVYRYLHAQTGYHFWTSNQNEISAQSGFHLEGIAFYTPNTGVPVYRFISQSTGNHFWTTDPNGEGLPKPEYIMEGIAFYSVQYDNTMVPVFRFFNAGTYDHFWTTDPNGEALTRPDYKIENIAFYSSKSGIPVYRFLHIETGKHFWTTDPNGEALPPSEIQLEGIAFYTPSSGVPVFRWYNR